MTAIIREFTSDDWPYIERFTKAIPCYDTCGVVAVEHDNSRLYGAFIFDHLYETSARVHVVMSSPVKAIRAGLLEAAADYIFTHHGKTVVIGITPALNRRSNRIAQHAGWRKVAAIPDAYGHGNAANIYEYRADECAWLQIEE